MKPKGRHMTRIIPAMIMLGLACLLSVREASAQKIDTTTNRVQPTMSVANAMKHIGTLVPRKVGEVKSEQVSVASQSARRSPMWLKQATIYQVWPRSFSREGTLKGVTAKMPYIADLGASIVYLTPINRMSTDSRPEFLSQRMRWSPSTKSSEYKNPYRIADYAAVDPEFGTEADLTELVAEAHKLGLKVIIDIVFFHCGPDNVLLERPGFIKRTPDGKPVLGQWKFPALNYESRELRDYLIGVLVHWVRDVKIDGFRCDVAQMVPLDFWEEAREALDKINPDVVMLSESDRPKQLIKAFNMSYNFPYYYEALEPAFRKGVSATLIRTCWEKMYSLFPSGTLFLHFSGHHGRDPADVVFGVDGAAATAVLNFTLDGIPCVYNGQEFGDTTLNDIMAKVPLRWDLAEVNRLELRTAGGAARLAFYKKLFEMRRRESALTSGELIWLDSDVADDVVTFLRKQGDEEVIVSVNLRNVNRKVSLTLPRDGVYASILPNSGPYSSPKGDISPKSWAPAKGQLSLAAFGFFVGKKQMDQR